MCCSRVLLTLVFSLKSSSRQQTFLLPPGERGVHLSAQSLLDVPGSVGLSVGGQVMAYLQKVRSTCCCIAQFWILLVLGKLKSTSACTISEANCLMPMARAILLTSFNHQNRMAASALSAGAEPSPEPHQGLLGRTRRGLDRAQGLCDNNLTV